MDNDTKNNMFDPNALISSYLEGSLNDEQFEQLGVWLKADEQNRLRLVRAVAMEQHLREGMRDEDMRLLLFSDANDVDEVGEMDKPWESLLDLSDEEDIEPVDITAFLKQQEILNRKGRLIHKRKVLSDLGDKPYRAIVIPESAAWLMGVAAMLMFVVLVYQGGQQESSVVVKKGVDNGGLLVEAVVVADVVHGADAIWRGLEGDVREIRAGEKFELERGVIVLSFYDGAEVTVEGPAVIRGIDDNAMGFEYGRLSAIVPERAHGFRVVTEHCVVTDLGTEFGVVVDEYKGVRTEVFEGKVVAENPLTHRPKVLQKGEAVAVDFDGLIREIPADSTAYIRDFEAYTHRPEIIGPGRYLKSLPESVAFHEFESTDEISVFMERSGHVLRDDVKTNLEDSEVIKAGEVVDSYLVHFDPVGGVNLSGKDIRRDIKITFKRPVIGLITSSELLYLSDASCGNEKVKYPLRGQLKNKSLLQRGVDAMDDVVRLSRDGRTVHVRLVAATNIDQFRVLVEAAKE